jgi:prepilin-type processing-associated H-X9-DG protein
MKRGCLVGGVICGGLVGVLVALMVPAVRKAREAARRSECICNLKWLIVALHNYHSQYGSLPVGTIPNSLLPPERRLGWVAEAWDAQGTGAILKVDQSKGWDEPPNWPPKVVAAENMRFVGMEPDDTSHWVTCPNDPRYRGPNKPFPLTYVGVAGVGADAATLPEKHPRAGAFGYDRVTRFADITDGMATTMVVVETTRGHGPWTAGGPSSIRGVDPATRPYIGRARPFGGYHPGGAEVAMADGSVKFIRETIDPKVFEALSTITGGETLPDGWDR